MSANNNEQTEIKEKSLDKYLLKYERSPRNPYEGKTIQHFDADSDDNTMSLFSIMDTDEYHDSRYFYRIPFGISNGTPVIENLSDISNLLITGITQSGKTAFLNTLLMSLMLSHTPDELCCFCFSSKPLEYGLRGRHPYVLLDNIRLTTGNILPVDVIEAIHTVKSRFPKMEIIIVMDDMYDFICSYGADYLITLLKMGISREIHVFMASTAISSKEVTPEIRALGQNFISFWQYKTVSRLLGFRDTESLDPRGDAIFLVNGMNYRCSTVFLDETELDRLNQVLAVERKSVVSDLISDMVTFSQTISLSDILVEDPLYDEVVEYIVDVQKASTSLLQRRFGIGYNRAVRLINLLEEKGFIGPEQGSKPREVYIQKEGSEIKTDHTVSDNRKSSASLFQKLFDFNDNNSKELPDASFNNKTTEYRQESESTMAYPLNEGMYSEIASATSDASDLYENNKSNAESVLQNNTSSDDLIYPKQSLIRKVTEIKEETVEEHYGLDTVCWIENGNLIIETTDLDLLPEKYVKDARLSLRNLFRWRPGTTATLTMDVHKIRRVTFGRPKKQVGYVHVYFDEAIIDVDFRGADNRNITTSKLDIMIPFDKTQEEEFESFAREIVRRSRT